MHQNPEPGYTHRRCPTNRQLVIYFGSKVNVSGGLDYWQIKCVSTKASVKSRNQWYNRSPLNKAVKPVAQPDLSEFTSAGTLASLGNFGIKDPPEQAGFAKRVTRTSLVKALFSHSSSFAAIHKPLRPLNTKSNIH